MKLQLVPPRTGLVWLRLGMQTFWRQPLALSGLFFMFMALISLAAMVPVIGGVVALALLPAMTLGFMAATREAGSGKFPMPTVLMSAFSAGRQRLRAMMQLGAMYAAGFLLVMGLSALADGGKFARLYLVGGAVTRELVMQNDFQVAMWVAVLLYLPLSLMFWHAPALVHWHGVAPIKSLFFSLVACMRNVGAYTLFGVAWLGVFLGGGVLVTLVGQLLGGPQVAAVALMPAALLMASMFFTSFYFTFRDSFVADEGEAP